MNGEGLNQIFGSLAQIKSISDKNKILVCYIENNYLVDYYKGIINDERTLLFVPGMHRLFIIESLYMIKKYNTIITYVTESDHDSKGFYDVKAVVHSLTELGKYKLKLLKLLLFEDDKFKDDNILSEKNEITTRIT